LRLTKIIYAAPPAGRRSEKNSLPDRALARCGMIRKRLQKRSLFLDAAEDLQHSSSVDMEFNSLEAKVAQFVGLCERLRAENHDLRQQLASARGDAKRLSERIESARARLEQLLQRLPD
jgi:cell division protein ZapB